MDIKQLQYFTTSADCGSFKRASELLYTTQPHISKSVKALEDELKVPLLVRKARGVELTEEGRRIYNMACRIIRDSEEIHNVHLSRLRSSLRIGCHSSDELTGCLTEYFMKLPKSDLQLSYYEGETTELINKLNHKHLDLAFVYIHKNKYPIFTQLVKQKHLICKEIKKVSGYLLVGPSSPFYKAESIKERELSKLSYIQLADDQDYYRCDTADPSASEVLTITTENPEAKTNSRQMLLNLLLHTGMASISCWLQPELVGETKIHRIPVPSMKNHYIFAALWNSRISLSNDAEQILQYVTEQLSNPEKLK